MRAALAAFFFISGLVVTSIGQLRIDRTPDDPTVGPDLATNTEKVIALGGAALALVAGFIAARYLARAVQMAFSPAGEARSTIVRIIVSVLGYIVVLVATLSALGFGNNLQGVLVGGAFTGVIIGIAAQQTLGNFFAGLVLIMVRPFTVGQRVLLRSGPLGGEYEGVVTDMTLFYVHMRTDAGPVQLPNAGVLASAVGPGARAQKTDDEKVDETQQEHGPAQGGPA